MTSGQSCGAGNGTFVVGDSRGAVMPGSSSVISPKSTGATVHHHGPPVDPPRESSFAHLCSQLQQSASLQAPANIMPERPHLSSDLSVDVADTQARKRIKLEPSYDISLMSATSPSSFCRRCISTVERTNSWSFARRTRSTSWSCFSWRMAGI